MYLDHISLLLFVLERVLCKDICFQEFGLGELKGDLMGIRVGGPWPGAHALYLKRRNSSMLFEASVKERLSSLMTRAVTSMPVDHIF